jgi:transketolase
LPILNEVPVETRRTGTARGGYIAVKETAALEVILLASGSELQHAVAAAKEIGAGARVVSMPSMYRFDKQDAAYREEVLPDSCRRRVAIEAGVPDLWYKYVGLDGKVIGISRFGLSAPGNKVMEVLGITAKAAVEAARTLAS